MWHGTTGSVCQSAGQAGSGRLRQAQAQAGQAGRQAQAQAQAGHGVRKEVSEANSEMNDDDE